MTARARDEMRASIADFCRHIDEAGESLRAEVRRLAVLIARDRESLDARLDQEDRELDRLEGRVSTLETRTSILEENRKPRRSRRGR